MNKGGILALLMAVMMLIISVPASAATVTIPGAPAVVTLPEEGISIPDGAYMRALTPDGTAGGHVNFQFNDGESNVFGAPLWDIASGIIGATISAHVVYNGADEAAVKEWDLTDVPITGYSKASTGARLGVTLENIIAHSNGAINSAADFGTITANGYIADNETPAHALTNIVLKAGTSTYYAGVPGKEVNTDPFPEGTVFLSAQKFAKGGSGEIHNAGVAWGGYDLFYMGSGHNITFIAKESGTYDVWELTSTHAGQAGRAATLDINGTTATVSDTTDRGQFSMMWAKTNATVTLEEGEMVTVTVNCGSMGRFAGAAFVPTESATPTENFITTSGAEGSISNNDLLSLHEFTTSKFTYGPDVNVTVDGAAVAAVAHSAANAGIASPATDAIGKTIINATVSDALVSAKKLPVPAGKVLAYLNGKKVVNPDVTYITENDVITTQTVTDGFTPFSFGDLWVKISNMQEISGALNVFFKKTNIGTDGKEAAIRADLLGGDLNNLVGAHFNGFLTPRYAGKSDKLVSNNGYTLFRNQAIKSVDFNYSDANYRAITSGSVSYTDMDAYQTEDNKTYVKDANGNILGVNPNTVADDPYCYVGANLYLTDKYTTGETIVIDNGTHKLITVDGADELFIVVKNADGTIASAGSHMVTWTTPYALTLTAGQKAYVWRYSNYIGTNMMPLCTVVE